MSNSMLDPEPAPAVVAAAAEEEVVSNGAPATFASAFTNSAGSTDKEHALKEEETESPVTGLGLEVEKTAPVKQESVPSTIPSVTALPTPEIKVIRRKLNGYVGFANLPKQWHRKSIRRGFNLNLLIVGESGLGKSTLINTLFNQEIYPTNEIKDPAAERPLQVTTEHVERDIEENGVKLHLTVVDAPGFGDQVNNTNAWQPIIDEVNSRFDSYLEFENKINRSEYTDSRIHALLYFIEPTGHCLKPLDIEFLLSIHKKVNVIPVIAKSDTLTEEEIIEFKSKILSDIEYQKIDIFKPTIYENDDEETNQITKDIISKIPFAIIGSTKEIQTKDGRNVRGREYPWGIIEVDNEDHNDFVKLRQLLIRNFMEELRENTSKILYENYRTEKLVKLGIEQDDTVFREFDPATKQQEEKALHEAKLVKLETEMKQIFQQKVSEKEKKLQKSEAELFSRHKEVKEKLLKQLKTLEDKKKQLENARLNPTIEPTPAPTKTRKGFLR